MQKQFVYVLDEDCFGVEAVQRRFGQQFCNDAKWLLFEKSDALLDHLRLNAQPLHEYSLISSTAREIGVGVGFAQHLTNSGLAMSQIIVHCSMPLLAQQEAQRFHDHFPDIPCHVAETVGEGFCATYHVPKTHNSGAMQPHEPRQRTYILEDEQYKYNDLITYHRDSFPDGQLLLFSDSNALTAHLRANFDPYDRYVLIADGVIHYSIRSSIYAIDLLRK